MADAELQAPEKNSDLGVRALSAIVMLAVAAAAVWAGGLLLDVFIALVALACLVEFVALVRKATGSAAMRLAGILFGIFYVGAACFFLMRVNSFVLLLIAGVVVLVDTFAYFVGRAIGGPKIAPSISPSKTWSGLGGAVVGATCAIVLYYVIGGEVQGIGVWRGNDWLYMIIPGAILAVVAQMGDFFESWLKRKAGVKDSSQLIPGHGGVFDRIDGLIPVAILVGGLVLTQYPHWLNR